MKKIVLISLFVLLEMLSIFLAIKSFSNKNIAETKEIYEIDKKQFSMYIENEEGNYEEYIESNKFPEGYQINIEKSKCVDTKGNVINGILTGSGTNITITSSKTSYCYLYFDKKDLNAAEKLIENVSSDMLWDSTLEGDGYRYVGTAPDNYVCFGYSNEETNCDFTNATNTDLYAYRIIGIFEDDEGKQHLKLIKKEALNETKKWHTSYSSNVTWRDSYVQGRINGVDFLTNTTYISANWQEKIVDYDWKYGDVTNENVTVQEIYNTEKVLPNTLSTTKIGLLTLTDYALSLEGGNNCSLSGEYKVCKTSWIHLSNNDEDNDSMSEWTMVRYGAYSGVYQAWNIDDSGYLSKNSLTVSVCIRPVFYLISEVTISGEGTIDNPYIITN